MAEPVNGQTYEDTVLSNSSVRLYASSLLNSANVGMESPAGVQGKDILVPLDKYTSREVIVELNRIGRSQLPFRRNALINNFVYEIDKEGDISLGYTLQDSGLQINLLYVMLLDLYVMV